MLVFSRVAMAAPCVVYAFATSWLHILAVEAFIGIELAAWSSGQSTYMIDLAPSKLRATYLAASMTAVGVSNFLGSYVMGIALTRVHRRHRLLGDKHGPPHSRYSSIHTRFLFLGASESKPCHR